MISKIFLISFLISLNSIAATNVICSDLGCMINGSSSSFLTKPCVRGNAAESVKTEYICDNIDTNYDVITSTDQYNDNLSVSSTALKNRNLLIYTKSGNNPGKNLVINAPALNKDSKASNFVVIGDSFNSVSINLNGYSGKKGKDASEICAENILADKYGSSIKAFYNQRRLDPSISKKCDDIDYQYMKDRSFSCEAGFNDVTLNDKDINSNNPMVAVTQIQQRSRCSAIASYNLCMKRKVRLQCGYKLYSTIQTKFLTAADVSPTNVNVNVVKYAPELLLWENEYNKMKVQYGGDKEICDAYHPKSSIRSSAGFAPSNMAEFYGGVSGYTQSKTLGIETNGIPSEKYSISVGDWVYQYTTANSTSYPVCTAPAGVDAYNSPAANSANGCANSVSCFVGQPAYSSSYVLNFNWNQSYNNFYNSTLSQYNLSNPLSIVSASSEDFCKDNSVPVSAYYKQYKRQVVTQYIKAAIWKTVETKSAIELGSNFYVQPPIQSSGKRYTLSGDPTLDETDVALVESEKFSDGSNVSERVFEYQKQPFFRSCNESENFLQAKQVYLNLTQFSSKTNTSCGGITDSRDVDNRLIWTYSGLIQDPSFNTETLNCSIGSCPVNISVSDMDYTLDNIAPESGESATEQGKGIIFAYDILNLTSQYSVGVAGNKGLNDIVYPRSEKICAKVDDYNQGPNSEQARHPLVTFKRYNWTPLISSAGGNEGVPAKNTGKKVEVFKKLDPAARYFIKARLL